MSTNFYQGRTKNEEHKSGGHSLYKIWFIATDERGHDKPKDYRLSFYNRTYPRKCYQYTKDLTNRMPIRYAKIYDNQTRKLLEVFENGAWRQPNNAELIKSNGG